MNFNDDILLSIIIPVYNCEKYILSCLDSILKQDVSGVEILCIDDGSTDKTKEFIESCQEKNQNVRIISYEKNMGAGYARNRGIESSLGKYLWFVDSDDYIAKDALRILHDWIVNIGGDLIAFDYTLQSDDMYYYTQRCDMSIEKFVSGKELFWIFNNNGNNSSSCFACYSKHFLTTNDIRFPVGHISEDGLFALKTILMAHSATYINQSLYYVRENLESVSRGSNKVEQFYGSFCLFVEIYRYLEDLDISDEEKNDIWSVVIREFICLKELFPSDRTEELDRKFKRGSDLYYPYLVCKSYINGYYKRCLSDEARKIIKGYSKAYVYGTGLVAKEIVHVLFEYDVEILNFIVSNKSKLKRNTLMGICIKSLRELENIDKTALIVVATHRKYYDVIKNNLEICNLSNQVVYCF